MNNEDYGPRLAISQKTHYDKYRGDGESFKEAMTRIAHSTSDNPEHFNRYRRLLYSQTFLPAGRVQATMGSTRETTPYNCYVSDTIPDSLEGIMDKLKEASLTMKLGGGIGYDFSTLRPRKDIIVSLDSTSSGPLSFMDMYDAMCRTILSAGHRRGAMMGVLRVDHPDIEEFIRAKQNSDRLTNFNISVAVTDKFMKAVLEDAMFDLTFNGRVYKTVRATKLWDEILRSTWDWAEPGILFIDTINTKNNLYYCESIAATNPCGEQPLPPYGACLLGSFNLVKYLWKDQGNFYHFDYERFKNDIPDVVRAMDNIVDRATYPLPEQEREAKDKRRMGLGVTGLANAIEALGFPYASEGFLKEARKILTIMRDACYNASVDLAIEKGSFPLYDRDKFADSQFVWTLPLDLQARIFKHGIRNSHLLSIAPCGTISLCADNVSSGLEPVFAYEADRNIITEEGVTTVECPDYGYNVLGIKGKTSDEVTVMEHVNVLNLCSELVDSACSKTCTTGDDVTWEQFKTVYLEAWLGGASGCTTFRPSGKRFGILVSKDKKEVNEGAACYIDPETNIKTCE